MMTYIRRLDHKLYHVTRDNKLDILYPIAPIQIFSGGRQMKIFQDRKIPFDNWLEIIMNCNKFFRATATDIFNF